MRTGLTRKLVLWVVAALLLLTAGFAAGFIACLQHQRTILGRSRMLDTQPEGDAPPEVRAGVLSALRAFQAGYTSRDVNAVDVFAQNLIDRDGEPLALGTEETEWMRGYPAVAGIIRNDWKYWGDLRLNLDGVIVDSNSTQDVAWLATPAEVYYGKAKRPLRFSAILVRKGGAWRFTQLQYQWDEHDAETSDLIRPGTYLRLFRIAMQKIAAKAGIDSSAAVGGM